LRCAYSSVDCKVCSKRGICEIYKELKATKDALEWYEELDDYEDSDEL